MLSKNCSFVLKTGETDGSQHFEKLPTNAVAIGTDANGNPIDNTAEAYKVKVNSSDAVAGYLDAKLADTTDVQFTPTDDQSQMDSIVYQLTGIGARLVAKDTGSFQWQGATYGSTLGGRGICSGRVYLSGIDTQVWACNDGVGAIYKTLDDWKTITLDNSWMTYMGGDPILYNVQPPCIKFVYSAHLSSYMWVLTQWPGYEPSVVYYYALHTPSNYNADGTLKSTAWNSAPCNHVIADIGVGPDNVACVVGNHQYISRTTDWNTWTDIFTEPSNHVIGGIDTDGYGNWIAVSRDYGVVYISQDNGLTWTAPSIYVRNTEEGDYAPASSLVTAGAVVAGNGIWLVASGNAYNYSTDGIYWTRYTTSLGSFYGMGFDGVKFFATNPMVAQSTKIWQLLVSEIPAHRHLVAEEGITADKAAYLPFLPSADVLGTDAMGKVVAKAGGGYTLPIASDTVLGGIKVGDNLTIDVDGTLNADASASFGKYMPTMDPAVATDVMIPSVIGSRSEVCVCMVPRVDMKINSSSQFATAMTQGATGTLIMTLRDVNYNLIAYSNALTDPTGSALLTASMGGIEDPITHNAITEYTLTAGTVYYLGLNYSMNGAAFIGVVASQTMNITPIVSKKFDNLTNAPDTLSGGSETTMRFYIRIKS